MGGRHSTATHHHNTAALTARQQVTLYRDALRLSRARDRGDATAAGDGADGRADGRAAAADGRADDPATRAVLRRALRHVEAEDREDGNVAPAAASATSLAHPQPTPTECAVCMADFDTTTPAFKLSGCGHGVLCRGCTRAYAKQSIADAGCFPWLTCPAAGCAHRIAPDDLVRLGGGVALSLATTLTRKQVVKFPEWTPCQAEGCAFGFFLDGKTGGAPGLRRCGVCRTRQRVRRKKEEPDDCVKQMIASGALRPCPKCGRHSMKDRGVCNVIQCMKCSCYWNWRTRETGRSYHELKVKGRKDGTLWESGELSYQQSLESSDKEAFKKLLKANGIKYKEGYKRGS